MQRPTLNLDVDAPDKVGQVLRRAAELYRESAVELSSAWQDRGAGTPWVLIAQKLDVCAEAIDVQLRKRGLV